MFFPSYIGLLLFGQGSKICLAKMTFGPTSAALNLFINKELAAYQNEGQFIFFRLGLNGPAKAVIELNRPPKMPM